MADHDTASILLGLLAPLKVGDAVVEGVVLAGVSTELGLRLRFEHAGAPAFVHVAPRGEGRRFAAASGRFAFSYRRGELDEALGLALCEALAARARVNEAEVLSRLPAPGSEAGGPRVRRVRVGTLLEPAGTAAERYFTLSPYVGCLIGCRFCYAQSHLASHRALSGLPETAWGSYVDVRVNAPEVLRRELPTIGDAAIKLCPVISDPYHALEAREELTRRCLAVLAEGPARDVLVLTRSALVERDLPLLAELGAHLGVSLPTLDDDVRRHFEPRAASIAERLNVLREARAVGVRTFAVVQPLLPGPIDALADALAATVGSVRVDVLHGVEAAARDFEGAHAVAREDAWQAERAAALVAALEARGVPRWSSELPPTG